MQKTGYFGPWHLTTLIHKSQIQQQELGAFLRILQWTVTIADEADESHALFLHTIPHPTDDPYNPQFDRTKMGKLVNKSKSYSPSSGSKPAASELCKWMRYWLTRHPRYLNADIVIPAPPGNPNKSFDLPLFMAENISGEFGMNQGECLKKGEMEQQKGIEQDLSKLVSNVSGKMEVQQDLTNKTVLVIDDLYQSGATVNEVVRASRYAGAQTVLSLVATKTAKYCNGLTASDWYDVSVEAEEGLGDK